MIRTAAIVLAATLSFAAQPASADPYKDRPTRVVQIADLDLSKPADQAKMVERVERAAKRICATEITRHERRKCARETVDYTMSLVGPEVRRAYAHATDREASFALARN
jgi:UrcA family protein